MGSATGKRLGKREEMRYWAIETSPGWLLVDEVAVTRPVTRILGQPTVEALCLFTSRVTVDAFIEGFFLEGSFSTRQELEWAFRDELQGTRETLEEPYLEFQKFTPRELVEVLRSMSSEVSYVAVDPDSSGQEVWDLKQFEAYLTSSAA
jgi:hypothetical protein